MTTDATVVRVRLRHGATPLRQVGGRELPAHSADAPELELDAEAARALLAYHGDCYAAVVPKGGE